MDAFKDNQLPQSTIARLEKNADKYWDEFYKFHSDKFFSDRHYFPSEFPLLLTAASILEVGCGAGNTAFPLLDINKDARIYACDFSETAVDIVQNHAAYTSTGRVTAFVSDITADDLLHHVPRRSIDACTMIFVLSAISPEYMPSAIANIARTLKPGSGAILFRDYCAGDLAEERLSEEGKQQKIADNFYARSDGTRAYYFEQEFLKSLFEELGFRCEEVSVMDQIKTNRKKGIDMGRRFIQGIFILEKEVSFSFPKSESYDDDAEDDSGLMLTRRHSVKLGPRIALDLQLDDNNTNNNSSLDSSIRLAELIQKQCQTQFLDKNVLFTGDPASVLVLAVACLRTCRRAVYIDESSNNIELIKINALRNGWQFAYERLRTALVKRNESLRGALAFRGAVDVVISVINKENMNDSNIVDECMNVLMEKGSEGSFLVVVGGRCLEDVDGGSDDVGSEPAVELTRCIANGGNGTMQYEVSIVGRRRRRRNWCGDWCPNPDS